MAEVIIFGGTREGRELAEYAASHGIPVLVSVAGAYGSQLLGAAPDREIQCGRLDREQMEALFIREKPQLVLDATHPHAVLVTENVKSACGKLGIPYERVLRESLQKTEGLQELENPAKCETLDEEWQLLKPENFQSSEGFQGSGSQGEILWADTAQEAAGLLNQDDQPILLTTGSRELGIFLSQVQRPDRIFARILPDSRVLAACEELGIPGCHVIAMQGPFTVEMNCALIRMTGAGWLVTKDSGRPGGYLEKLRAAQICGIRTVVIRRPRETEGICLEEAKGRLDLFGGARHGNRRKEEERQQGIQRWMEMQSRNREVEGKPKGKQGIGTGTETRLIDGEGTRKRHLTLVGMGMGGGSQLTAEAMEAISQAQVIFGAKRMLEDVKAWTSQAQALPFYRGAEIADWLKGHDACRQAVAVYSGDTGFHSGCASLLEAMKKTWGDGPEGRWEIRVLPGISTVSCLCARFQVTYEDLYLASAHGRECRIGELIREHPRIFLLLGGGEDLAGICRELCAAGQESTRVMAGIRLGYPDEQLLSGVAEEFCQQKAGSLAAVILERVSMAEEKLNA